jgi:hypothetical protein
MTELSFGLCRDAAYYGTVGNEKANDNGKIDATAMKGCRCQTPI